MALSREEFSEMLAQVLPEDLPADPEVSIRPSEATMRRRAKASTTGAGTRTDLRLPRWALKQPSDTKFPEPAPLPEEETPLPISSAPEPPPTEAEYILCRMMGRGGFGEVWEAIQGSVGRIVAVKRLRDDLIEKQTYTADEADRMVEDFQREALTTALLEHPNIVPVHDVGTDETGRPLLAMKMVRGERWDNILAAERDVLPLADFLPRQLAILTDVAQAVSFAHSRGIVHRDLKPAQVMVGEFGETVLMDWGMAVLYDPEMLNTALAGEHSGLGIAPTREEAFNPTGTPSYMAPEQTLPTAEQIGPWTDVYLLGGLLYYILTGRGPHAVGDSKEAFALASQGYVIPFDEACPGREIPADLAGIAMTALAAEPKQRYPSAREFLGALEEYRTGSGRRRESIALTEEVAASVPDESADYQTLSDASTKLMRAVTLWPGNPDARPLQNRVYHQFAQTALGNNDLVLARLMAESIDERHDKTMLLELIYGASKQSRWNERQKFVLKVVTSILVAVILFDIYILYAWSRTGSDNALANRASAAETRAEQAETELRELREQLEALTSGEDQ